MSRSGRLLLFGVFITLLALMTIKLVKRADEGREDLSIYHRAAQKLIAGESPYRPGRMTYIYPPLFATLLRPIAGLSPRWFAVVWAFFLGGCWIGSIWLVRYLLSRSNVPLSFFVDVLPSIIVFRWIWSCWGRGQLAVLLLALMLAALVFDRHRRFWLAGLMLAIGGGIKVFPLFAGLIFLRRGRLTGVVAIGMSLVVLQLLTIAQLGLDGYVHAVRDGFIAVAVPEIHSQQLYWDNRAPVASLLRWLSIESRAAHSIGFLIWTALCASLAVWLRPPPGDERENAWLAFVVTCAMAMPPVIWPHYFAILVFPFAVVLDQVERDPSRPLIGTGPLVLSAVLLNANLPVLTDTLGLKILEDLPNLGLMIFWGGLLSGLIKLRAQAARPVVSPCVSGSAL